jgi:glucose-fructose oxidoreductase
MKRRKFLYQTGFGLLAASVPNIIVPKPKKSIGVALVGLGYYSRDLLAPALQLTKHCHLAGIVTGTPSKIPVWQKKYNISDKNVYNYQNMHQIADNLDIDVLYIVTPNGLHLPHAEEAANAGKHVWCEKPMTTTGADAQKMIEICKKNKVQLTIGYRMQHEPNTRTIMEWAKTRPFGKIKRFYAEAGWYNRGRDHWKLRKKLGGGAMYDMGTYPLNAARYATGEEPIAVTAKHIIKRPEIFTEVDETTEFSLEFKSGLVAECVTSFGQKINRLEVTCDDGSYYLEPFQSYNGVVGAASDGTKLHTYIANQQTKQMDDDALAIINDTPPRVPGEDGLKDMLIIDAIFESARKRGKRIKIVS